MKIENIKKAQQIVVMHKEPRISTITGQITGNFLVAISNINNNIFIVNPTNGFRVMLVSDRAQVESMGRTFTLSKALKMKKEAVEKVNGFRLKKSVRLTAKSTIVYVLKFELNTNLAELVASYV